MRFQTSQVLKNCEVCRKIFSMICVLTEHQNQNSVYGTQTEDIDLVWTGCLTILNPTAAAPFFAGIY